MGPFKFERRSAGERIFVPQARCCSYTCIPSIITLPQYPTELRTPPAPPSNPVFASLCLGRRRRVPPLACPESHRRGGDSRHALLPRPSARRRELSPAAVHDGASRAGGGKSSCCRPPRPSRAAKCRSERERFAARAAWQGGAAARHPKGRFAANCRGDELSRLLLYKTQAQLSESARLGRRLLIL